MARKKTPKPETAPTPNATNATDAKQAQPTEAKQQAAEIKAETQAPAVAHSETKECC